ncbi:unnamed protein product, partial [Nesidiocoris tenuis]
MTWEFVSSRLIATIYADQQRSLKDAQDEESLPFFELMKNRKQLYNQQIISDQLPGVGADPPRACSGARQRT